LREICSSSGTPKEAPLLCSILWKVNLKLFDLNVKNWADILDKKRSEYNNMKEAFIMKMEFDGKMVENSSGNDTYSNANCNNNLLRKNGDSVNETGEKSKDSSGKSKSKSRNNLNNKSKSRLSSNNNNNNNNCNFNNSSLFVNGN